MPEILSAGIYSQIVSSGERPIQGVSTATMATIGFTLKGETNKPTLVTGLRDATNKFGSFTTKSDLMYGLKLFFENGGSRAYVNRIVPTNAATATYMYQESAVDKWEFAAANEGAWANSHSVFLRPNADDTTHRDIYISESSTQTTVRSNTIGSGSTTTVVTLDSGASATNNYYNGSFITVTISGATETRKILSYDVNSSPNAKQVTVDYAFSQAPSGTYTISDIVLTNVIEVYEDVSFSDADASEKNYVTTVINDVSANIYVTLKSLVGAVPGMYTLGVLAAGSDGTINVTYFPDSLVINALTPGLSPFDRIEGGLLNFALPDFEDDIIQSQLVTYVSSRHDCFAILSHPYTLTEPTVNDASGSVVSYVRTTLNVNPSYGKAALYSPWVKVYDALRNKVRVMSPSTMVAGIFARNDTERNVGKAPSGDLRGISGLQYQWSRGEMDILYPARINPLESLAITGMDINGVRTLSIDPEWRYINAPRVMMFLDISTVAATQWIKFENNGSALWTKVKMQMEGFLNTCFVQGMFAGSSSSEAYFVIVDSSNNPQSTINNGYLFIDVGVAIHKPAEFVVFRFQQKIQGKK